MFMHVLLLKNAPLYMLYELTIHNVYNEEHTSTSDFEGLYLIKKLN